MNTDTIVGRIDHFAAENPDRTAILFEDRRLGYRQFADASIRLASVLRDRGVSEGDRVCLLAGNSPEYLIFYHAVLRCGAALFPINSDLTASEIAFILGHAEPALVVCDAGRRMQLEAALEAGAHALANDRLEALIEDSSTAGLAGKVLTPRRESDLALVIYTSGTTSAPKGVPATDRIELRSADSFAQVWQVKADDLFVCALPLSFLFGLHTATMVAFSQGASVLLFERFHPVKVLAGIERHRASVMLGVPTMYSMMLEHVAQTGKCYDLGSVRLSVSSGAPLAIATRQALEGRLGLRLQDYYALSECRPIFSVRADRQGEAPIGSVGPAVPDVEVRLVDDAGQEVQRGETGSVLVRSPTLTTGYFRDPERSAAAFVEGWFVTGDLARQDESGFFYISGRTRDQVISGGQKISAIEVENILLQHPAVEQVAVVGVPDEKYGELLKAVLVLRNGAPSDEEALLAHCRERMAAYKLPRLFSFREALPLSPAGKVLKRELIDE